MSGLQGILEIELFSGVVAHVTPLSPLAYRAIEAKAYDLHPDPKPPLVPLENSAVEDRMVEDKNDPAYLAALNEARAARSAHVTRIVRDMAISFPDGREALTARFADKIRTLRNHGLIPAAYDDWQVAFEYIIVTTAEEWQTLNNACVLDSLPLGEAEIRDGARYFRLPIQGRGAGKVVAAPGLTARSRGVKHAGE